MKKTLILPLTAIAALFTLTLADSETNTVPIQWSGAESNAYNTNAKLHSDVPKNRRWMVGGVIPPNSADHVPSREHSDVDIHYGRKPENKRASFARRQLVDIDLGSGDEPAENLNPFDTSSADEDIDASNDDNDNGNNSDGDKNAILDLENRRRDLSDEVQTVPHEKPIQPSLTTDALPTTDAAPTTHAGPTVNVITPSASANVMHPSDIRTKPLPEHEPHPSTIATSADKKHKTTKSKHAKKASSSMTKRSAGPGPVSVSQAAEPKKGEHTKASSSPSSKLNIKTKAPIVQNGGGDHSDDPEWSHPKKPKTTSK